MKINELSRMSLVNPETIRMYRKLGLLRPDRNPNNGYYDYSRGDFMSLLFVRKLRGSGLSLDAISYTYFHSDPGNILDGYQQDFLHIDEELEKLKRWKFMLQVTIDHLEVCKENMRGVITLEAKDDRLDYYPDFFSEDEITRNWIQNIEFFTQTLLIPREILEQKELPERIPVTLGLGSYRYIIDAIQAPVPEQVVVCPRGTYVAATVELTRLDSIDRRQLQPMLEYISRNHYVIDSDTTAFLFQVNFEEGHPRLVYRLRVKVRRSVP